MVPGGGREGGTVGVELRPRTMIGYVGSDCVQIDLHASTCGDEPVPGSRKCSCYDNNTTEHTRVFSVLE